MHSWRLLLCSLVFGISYTQAPLYYSNQNQYFLHGLAAAGRGDLRHDWLANTKDPTPLFSGIVFVTARYLHEDFFYLYYLLILGLYFYSLVGVFTVLAPAPTSPSARWGFLIMLLLLHAGIVRWASAQLFGVDYPWFFQAGVAGQYLLGFGLQPSVFGVFLLTSVLAFLREQPRRAVIWACLAAVLHATYLPMAALLTLAYMVATFHHRGLRDAVLLGGLALVLVMPAVIYSLVTFAPTAAADFAEAQRILAHVRIPHHAEIKRWLDPIAAAQILWIVSAMFLVRRHRLFPLMVIPFLGSLLLTLVQVATRNDTLALLFPWRTTTFLVPLATAVNLTWFVVKLAAFSARSSHAGGRLPSPPVLGGRVAVLLFRGMGFVVALGCMLGGLAVPLFGLGYRTNKDELPMLEFIRNHHRPGDVYLIPAEVPKPWSGTPGVFSSNFLPEPRRGMAGGFIAIDLQQFRFATGAPLYVDFKSIPYQDEEVLEWDRRLRWCAKIYGDTGISAPDLHAALMKEGITYVVTPAGKMAPFAGLAPAVYQDEIYGVFPIAKK